MINLSVVYIVHQGLINVHVYFGLSKDCFEQYNRAL